MVELLSRLAVKKILLRELNEPLTCHICSGYLVDPVVINECQHTFCKTCILEHYEDELDCPVCGTISHPTTPEKYLIKDEVLQQLIKEILPRNDVESTPELVKKPLTVHNFLVRLLPANRRTDPLIRPFVYITGDTPMRVLWKCAGSPRYLHFKQSRIRDMGQSLFDWAKSEPIVAPSLDPDKEYTNITFRFTK